MDGDLNISGISSKLTSLHIFQGLPSGRQSKQSPAWAGSQVICNTIHPLTEDCVLFQRIYEWLAGCSLGILDIILT